MGLSGWNPHQSRDSKLLSNRCWSLQTPKRQSGRGGLIETNHANVKATPWPTIAFAPFGVVPVVTTSVMTENGLHAVVTRNRAVTKSSFEISLQEEKAGDQIHVNETIGFLAWEPGVGNINGLKFQAASGFAVTDAWTSINFTPFATIPAMIMDMQTVKGIDPCNLRYRKKGQSSVEVHVVEEKSVSQDMSHTNAESTGFIVFGN